MRLPRHWLSSLFVAAFLPACLMTAMVRADTTEPGLYSARVIVTGRDNLAERARGIREALPLVLTKVAADGEIAGRAVAQGLAEEAEALVEGLDYVDRKEGIQISDEQGTRERSFELTVSFDPQRIDKMVAKLGGSAWRSERPEIGIALLVEDGGPAYLLTRSSAKGYGQRLAFDAEAQALALPISLPEDMPAGETAERQLMAAGRASPVRLEGRMTVTPAGYWNTSWRLEGEGVDERFATAATTFDAAIGEALRRSAKALATR